MPRMFSYITHTVNPIAGGPCPYSCSYCRATALKRKYGFKKYLSEYRLFEKEFRDYPDNSFVFVDDMSDIGDPKIPKDIIHKVFTWMQDQPNVNFLLLTKNPEFFLTYIDLLQPNIFAGSTIESNHVSLKFSKAPSPNFRKHWMLTLRDKRPDIPRMVSIEPIMKFEPVFIDWILDVDPQFVAVGYDNYKNNLEEPFLSETEFLISKLENAGVKIYRKTIRERIKNI